MGLFDNLKMKFSQKEIEEHTCPYCFEKIKNEDLVFRATQGNPENDELLLKYKKEKLDESIDDQLELPIMDPKSDGIREIKRRDKSQGNYIFRVEHKEYGSSSKRLCPKCHNDLPSKFSEVPIVNISLFGSTKSGKTTFLLKLLETLRHQKIGNLVAYPLVDSDIDGKIIKLEKNVMEATNTEIQDHLIFWKFQIQTTLFYFLYMILQVKIPQYLIIFIKVNLDKSNLKIAMLCLY